MESIWKEVKIAVRSRIPDHSFRMWIEPLEIKKGTQDSIILACPNYFSKKKVLDYYGKLIESEIQRAVGKPCGFTVEVDAQNNSAKSVKDQDLQLPLPNIIKRPHNGRFFKKDFTFDEFVVGGNNDFAYSASLSLASRRNSQQNSLFLLSKIGMGKSHLSQAIGHYI